MNSPSMALRWPLTFPFLLWCGVLPLRFPARHENRPPHIIEDYARYLSTEVTISE
jgi:hypothetical protein